MNWERGREIPLTDPRWLKSALSRSFLLVRLRLKGLPHLLTCIKWGGSCPKSKVEYTTGWSEMLQSTNAVYKCEKSKKAQSKLKHAEWDRKLNDVINTRFPFLRVKGRKKKKRKTRQWQRQWKDIGMANFTWYVLSFTSLCCVFVCAQAPDPRVFIYKRVGDSVTLQCNNVLQGYQQCSSSHGTTAETDRG